MSRTLHCQEDITKVFSTKCTRRVSLSGWFGNDIGWASSDFSCYSSFFTKMYSISDLKWSMSRTLHCGEGVCQWIIYQKFFLSKYTPTLWINFGWVSHEMYCVTSIFTKKYSIQDLKWSMSRALHRQEDKANFFSTKCIRRVSLSGWFGNDIGWASSDFYCNTSFFTKTVLHFRSIAINVENLALWRGAWWCILD
jgi:hypothetical protein